MNKLANKVAEGERSPWVDAGIGAGGGSLLAAALGYIYGHRGKWLAYDTLAGGLGGGAAGYAIGATNKERIDEKEKKISQAPRGSLTYSQPKSADQVNWKQEFFEDKRNAKESLRGNPSKWERFKAFISGDLDDENKATTQANLDSYLNLRRKGLSHEHAMGTVRAGSRGMHINPLWWLGHYNTDISATTPEQDKAALNAAGLIVDGDRVRPMNTDEMSRVRMPKLVEQAKQVLTKATARGGAPTGADKRLGKVTSVSTETKRPKHR